MVCGRKASTCPSFMDWNRRKRVETARLGFTVLIYYFFCVQTAGGMNKGEMCQALAITFITNDETILRQL